MNNIKIVLFVLSIFFVMPFFLIDASQKLTKETFWQSYLNKLLNENYVDQVTGKGNDQWMKSAIQYAMKEIINSGNTEDQLLKELHNKLEKVVAMPINKRDIFIDQITESFKQKLEIANQKYNELKKELSKISSDLIGKLNDNWKNNIIQQATNLINTQYVDHIDILSLIKKSIDDYKKTLWNTYLIENEKNKIIETIQNKILQSLPIQKITEEEKSKKNLKEKFELQLKLIGTKNWTGDKQWQDLVYSYAIRLIDLGYNQKDIINKVTIALDEYIKKSNSKLMFWSYVFDNTEELEEIENIKQSIIKRIDNEMKRKQERQLKQQEGLQQEPIQEVILSQPVEQENLLQKQLQKKEELKYNEQKLKKNEMLKELKIISEEKHQKKLENLVREMIQKELELDKLKKEKKEREWEKILQERREVRDRRLNPTKEEMVARVKALEEHKKDQERYQKEEREQIRKIKEIEEKSRRQKQLQTIVQRRKRQKMLLEEQKAQQKTLQ